jgi:hypothetical protein
MRPLGRSRRIRENNIKMDICKSVFEAWIEFGWPRIGTSEELLSIR